MHGRTAPFVSAPLALANVHAGTDANAARREGRDQFQATTGSFGGPVEQREHAVAGVLGAAAAELRQQIVDNPVMKIELVAPVLSPSAANRSVEPTMSVNNTVESTRSFVDSLGVSQTKSRIADAIASSKSACGPGGSS